MGEINVNKTDIEKTAEELINSRDGATTASTATASQYEMVAKPNCKKCYGRGIIGRDILTNKYWRCKCVKRVKVEKKVV